MIDFTVLALPGAFASGVGATIDILSNAASLAGTVGCSLPRWRVCSTEKTVMLSNGFYVEASVLPRTYRADESIWVVPGLGLNDDRAIASRLAHPDAARAIEALRRHASRGGSIAASCSAVFLLHEAGLLAGKRVTTTWWLGGILQQMEPDCNVDTNQMVIADGNIITGGAAFAHVDLMLYLLRSRFSPALADAVARSMVIDGRQCQSPYIVPVALANGDELATRVVARFEAGLPNPPTIAQIASEFCMSNRTLARHIKAETGRNLSALLQSVRINRARMLLETSRMSVDQIAEQVGYADRTALRRLMRRQTKATPKQFRPALFDDHRQP
jgi:transcriptional regulator GlxA family with amidase domain